MLGRFPVSPSGIQFPQKVLPPYNTVARAGRQAMNSYPYEVRRVAKASAFTSFAVGERGRGGGCTRAISYHAWPWWYDHRPSHP